MGTLLFDLRGSIMSISQGFGDTIRRLARTTALTGMSMFLLVANASAQAALYPGPQSAVGAEISGSLFVTGDVRGVPFPARVVASSRDGEIIYAVNSSNYDGTYGLRGLPIGEVVVIHACATFDGRPASAHRNIRITRASHDRVNIAIPMRLRRPPGGAASDPQGGASPLAIIPWMQRMMETVVGDGPSFSGATLSRAQRICHGV